MPGFPFSLCFFFLDGVAFLHAKIINTTLEFPFSLCFSFFYRKGWYVSMIFFTKQNMYFWCLDFLFLFVLFFGGGVVFCTYRPNPIPSVLLQNKNILINIIDFLIRKTFFCADPPTSLDRLHDSGARASEKIHFFKRALEEFFMLIYILLGAAYGRPGPCIHGDPSQYF